MKIQTNGITRIVFVFKNFVIKIPKFTYKWDHFLRGLIGNISENQTWKYNSGKYESGYSHLLCPVIWCSWGGWILIMKRAKILEGDISLWNITEHQRTFKGDDEISNYGIYKGNLVKIDYAELDYAWGEDFK